MSSSVPRGVRNNNPGNIELGEKWQGLAEDQTDQRFCVFSAPHWGIRAIARILIRYHDHYRINTVAGVINRWAPPHENDTDAYARAGCKRTGFGLNEPLDLHSYEHMEPLVKAIIWHENGQQPYTQAVIDHGLLLAGVEPAAKPLVKNRAMQAGTLAASATVATPLLEMVREMEPYTPMIQTVARYAPWVLPGVAAIAIGYIIWGFVEDRRRGLR